MPLAAGVTIFACVPVTAHPATPAKIKAAAAANKVVLRIWSLPSVDRNPGIMGLSPSGLRDVTPTLPAIEPRVLGAILKCSEIRLVRAAGNGSSSAAPDHVRARPTSGSSGNTQNAREISALPSVARIGAPWRHAPQQAGAPIRSPRRQA